MADIATKFSPRKLSSQLNQLTYRALLNVILQIDDAVMKGCRQHMKSVCGDCLDNYDGDKHKVIVGDAIAHMKDYLKEGRQFDYVFGDLTDVPISPTPRGEHWDFMRTIMNLGTKVTKPGTGKYMTHAIGIQCDEALKMFEEQLDHLDVSNSYTSTSHFIPCFMEKWCFYQVTVKKV